MLLTNTSGVNSQNSISEYIQYVNSLPILTEGEEKSLLMDFIKNGNQIAGKKVAEAHLRVVVKIAMDFRKYHHNMWDLISEGNIGLLKALKNFSLEKNVRFVTYAMLWVKASIQEFVLHSSSFLKINIGAVQKKIMFNIGKVKESIKKYSKNECTTKEIAKILQVPEKEVLYISNAIAANTNSEGTSLDTSVYEDSSSVNVYDITPSNDATPEENFYQRKTESENNKMLQNCINNLNEREKSIIQKRFLSNNTSTLLDLSKEFHISVERVRQIEASALKKMRKYYN